MTWTVYLTKKPHKQMTHTSNIQHDLREMSVKPAEKTDRVHLKNMISPGMDQYLDDELVPAQTLHDEIRQRYGDAYRTPGYYLRLYRLRASLTQVQLAGRTGIHRRHISEMENNKRSIDKTLARKLAHIPDFDCRKLI